MRIAVLGSGVIGTTAAYYLAKAGHDVVVVDRRSGPALETSFANAGEISPGYASPWAAPGIPQKALKWLMMKHAPLILPPAFDRDMLNWLLAMLGNCTASRYAINKERMVRLAEFSRDRLMDLRAETGVQYELLDRMGCIAAEPGLALANDNFVGGLRLPNDETGDCYKFTNALAKLAEGLGVRFHFGRSIDAIEVQGGQVSGVRTRDELIVADCYVVALGSYSAGLVRPLGLKLPVYPVKGYAITAQILDAERAPVSTLLDETYKVAITRLGGRIRVGGMAEISGYGDDLPARRRATLVRSVGGLFPGAGDLASASFWSGLRPMTPDSTPIIGATSIDNLYLNTGHGTLGWTMACGSAHVLTDILCSRKPAIETHDLSIARYGR